MDIVDARYLSSKIEYSHYGVYIKDTPTPIAHIHLIEGIKNINESYVNDHIDLLPSERRQRCMRYKNLSDRVSCILSYMLLKNTLESQYNVLLNEPFVYSENQKPYLKNHNDIFFNISHTKNTVAVTVASFEIGIDVEEIKDIKPGLIDMVASPKEKEIINAACDKKRAFFRLWTMKESYAKAYSAAVASFLKKDICETGYVYIESDKYQMSTYLGRYQEHEKKSEEYFEIRKLDQ